MSAGLKGRPLIGDPAFLYPKAKIESLDRYTVRKAILREITRVSTRLQGFVLDVGCGQMPYRLAIVSSGRVEKYVGLDVPTSRYGVDPDLVWDGRRIPLPEGTVDWVIATEVLEHCPEPNVILTETHRVLKPGGHFFFTVPFLWPLHEVPHDEYRYTPFALDRLLRQSGYTEVEIRALGGWDASLAQMIGLWVRRRPLSSWKQRLFSAMAVPIIKWLTARDEIPQRFLESTMITGLVGIATARSAVP